MKDLRYYTHFAESLPVCGIVGEAVHQSLVNANLLGFGDKYVAFADRSAGEAWPAWRSFRADRARCRAAVQLLVLGGTRFLGRHVVDAALARRSTSPSSRAAARRCRGARP